MTLPYIYDECSRVWLRTNSSSIEYSDGAELETELLEALKKTRDLSCSSFEIQELIKNWPTEYHLSDVRHNLLRPFPIGSNHCILELGCGCGALTRYLGETGAEVIAVEGSLLRARIAAERCRDLPNVRVYCDNIANFRIDQEFDYVTLIGVLEYAQLFVDSPTPVDYCLELAHSYLKMEGALVLAIENKLGLKYFAGCREDHVGIPYFGVNDLYTRQTPVTFGKKELARYLHQNGFNNLDFYYPFPDYKLPNLLISEAGTTNPKLNLKDLLIHSVARDYPRSQTKAFAEGIAWGPLSDNELVGEMANSFLVFAYKNGSLSSGNWLAKIYGKSLRKRRFQIETSIAPDADVLRVSKNYLFSDPKKQASDSLFQHVLTDSVYLQGHLLLREIHLALVRQQSLEEILSTFHPWIAYLQKHASLVEGGKYYLPPNFIDCIPANLIIEMNGKIEYLDAEWVYENPIPMAWVLIRGVIYSLSGYLDSAPLRRITYRQFIDELLKGFEIGIEHEDYFEANEVNKRFSEFCHVPLGVGQSLIDIIDQPIWMMPRMQDNQKVEAEIKRLKATISWRVTAPFRVLWNVCLRIVECVKR